MKNLLALHRVIVILVFLLLTKVSYGFEVEGITYFMNEDNKSVYVSSAGHSQYTGNICIPQEVSYKGVTYPVTSIGGLAFMDCENLTSIIIPSSIRSIGISAFSRCKGLTNIVIPESVDSIPQRCFEYCSNLSSVQLPNSIKGIGKRAFDNCVSLANISLPESLNKIGDYAFGRCVSLTSISIPGSVEIIPQGCFNECRQLKEIVLHNGTRQVCFGAFATYEEDVNIHFPPTVQVIEGHVISSGNMIFYRGGFSIDTQTSNVNVIVLDSANPVIKNKGDAKLFVANKMAFLASNIYESSNVISLGEFGDKESYHIFEYDGTTIPLKNGGLNSLVPLKELNLNWYCPAFDVKDAGLYYGNSEIQVSYNEWSSTFPISYGFNILKAKLDIAVNSVDREYGEANPTFSFLAKGFKENDNVDNSLNNINFICSALPTSNVGTYEISLIAESQNYDLKLEAGILTVTKAPLNIAANNVSRLYAEENPVFNVKYEGFKFADTEETSFSVLPRFECDATKASDVGEYPITVSGGISQNYKVVESQPGTLTIKKAPLTMTASNAKRMYYDENPQFNYTLTGLRNNDDVSCVRTQPKYECSADISSDCGAYAIIPSNADAKNYEISYVNGTLTVTPANLTLKAQNVTREYGDENPVLTFEADGLKGADVVETALQTLPTLTSTALSTSNVGEYPISITGGSSKNYTLSYRSGLMTITKAPLSVLANNAERIYGDSNPTFSRSYLGFKLSDSESTAFSVLPRIECTATKTSNVGEYPIMVSGGISRNYEFASYENAILTIKPASATIIATDNSRSYFEDNPQFDFTVSGLRNSDTRACIATLPQYNCLASKTSSTGNYEIMPYGAIAQNYVFEYKAGSLIVNKRDLTASIGNYSRVYGTDNPDFAISYTGFVNNEEATELNQTVVATCEATKLSDVGTYSIILSGGKADNYDISSYNNGTLTIEKADQTISWNQDLSSIVMSSQVALEAASTSNLPVAYEMSPNNVATLYNNGGKWYLDCYGSGAVSIRAIQNGDKNHNAAPIVTKTMVVYGNGGDEPSNPQIYLNIEEPGSLSSMIADNRKFQIKNLRLTGNLNGTDINFIREMAGCDSYGKTTPGVLEILDISGCTIVSGGRSYYLSNKTSDYVVGNYMFYNCKTLSTLRLPENSVSIGNSAFADCDRLTVLSIPNSVKSFGDKSFANAISLLRIPMPDNLTTIGDMAFIGCNGLSELSLPESVYSIGDGIVNECQNLSQINVEVGNANFASRDGVLYNSTFDELLIFPVNHVSSEYRVIEGVTSIAPYAFYNAKKLTVVNLPSSLTSIGKDAFIGCVNLSALQVNALTPPICQNDCFENVSKTRCELQVPLGCRSYYWVAPVWSEFNKIVESGSIGIENVMLDSINISVENGTINISGCPVGIPVRIYQADGTLIFSQYANEGLLNFAPNTSGFYLIVIGNKPYKLILK